MQGKLVIFSAPSGAGKTTIVRYLLGLDLGLEFSISATSRNIRGKEVYGKDYYFLSAEEFELKIENNEFIEWEEVYAGQYYGTLKSEVERIRNKGKHVVFDVDVVGGLNIKKQYKLDAIAIFIQTPSYEVLEERLRARSTEDEASLKKRLYKALKEFEFAAQFDRIIMNDSLDEALLKAREIVTNFIN
jgi:guanylate kinase